MNLLMIICFRTVMFCGYSAMFEVVLYTSVASRRVKALSWLAYKLTASSQSVKSTVSDMVSAVYRTLRCVIG